MDGSELDRLVVSIIEKQYRNNRQTTSRHPTTKRHTETTNCEGKEELLATVPVDTDSAVPSRRRSSAPFALSDLKPPSGHSSSIASYSVADDRSTHIVESRDAEHEVDQSRFSSSGEEFAGLSASSGEDGDRDQQNDGLDAHILYWEALADQANLAARGTPISGPTMGQSTDPAVNAVLDAEWASTSWMRRRLNDVWGGVGRVVGAVRDQYVRQSEAFAAMIRRTIRRRIEERIEYLLDERMKPWLEEKMYGDPDMPGPLRNATRVAVQNLWLDLKEEFWTAYYLRYKDNQGLEERPEHVRSAPPVLLMARWKRPLHSIRCFILYHLCPFDRSFWGRLRDPYHLLIKAVQMFPLFSVSSVSFLILLGLIDRTDEYQLVSYILQFKGTQFLTVGLFSAFLGALRYYLCVNLSSTIINDGFSDGPRYSHSCHRSGPGNNLHPLFDVGAFVLQILLVWSAFKLLPYSEKKGCKISVKSGDPSENSDGKLVRTLGNESDSSICRRASASAFLANSSNVQSSPMPLDLSPNDAILRDHKKELSPSDDSIPIVAPCPLPSTQSNPPANQAALLPRLQEPVTIQSAVPRLRRQISSRRKVRRRDTRVPIRSVPIVDEDGRRAYSFRGGYLSNLLHYDLSVFVAIVLLGLLMLVVRWYNAGDVQWWDWRLKMDLYWLKTIYGLASFPFFFFVAPVIGTILHHGRPTGYDRYGQCVPQEINFKSLHTEAPLPTDASPSKPANDDPADHPEDLSIPVEQLVGFQDRDAHPDREPEFENDSETMSHASGSSNESHRSVHTNVSSAPTHSADVLEPVPATASAFQLLSGYFSPSVLWSSLRRRRPVPPYQQSESVGVSSSRSKVE